MIAAVDVDFDELDRAHAVAALEPFTGLPLLATSSLGAIRVRPRGDGRVGISEIHAERVEQAPIDNQPAVGRDLFVTSTGPTGKAGETWIGFGAGLTHVIAIVAGVQVGSLRLHRREVRRLRRLGLVDVVHAEQCDGVRR